MFTSFPAKPVTNSKIMMKMNGLKLSYYYITHYLHFFFMHTISSSVFLITGAAFSLEFFVKSSAGIYLILIFLWGNVQIAMAFLLSVFFSKARVAL